VDHGTAYDIAGTGKANEANLLAAINLAATMATNRTRRAASAC
jgi:4-hydroxythreonine-4-phosphate dehydrogenase